MDKLNMHTANKADENFARLAAMFPNAVTESIDENGEVVRAIDKDVLMQEISTKVVDGNEERYQFTWPDKKKAILAANAPISSTLRPCHAESVNFDSTENLYIEGDNLDVLKLLQETYLGKVKMIYIDPPYNTGNDFVYNDDFAQSADEYMDNSGQYDADGNRLVQNSESNGRFHTDWLNMIYPRLKLAKDLLSDDGVIFISIDENEVYNMQKICNEIFGAENYAATFIWTKTSTPPALAYKCRKTVEYVLAFEKKSNTQKYFGSLLDNGDAPLLNTGNPIKTLVFPKGSVHFNFIENGKQSAGIKDKVTLERDFLVKDGINEQEIILSGPFKWTQDTLANEIEAGTYFIIKTDKYSIRFQRVDNDDSYKTPTNFINVELNAQTMVGTNESAVKELSSMKLENYFSYPKPISLVSSLISMVSKFDKNSIILDFFSGSATTAHAVMQLNAEDGGHRKFIMVQLPEQTDEKSEAYKAGYKNICEIGKERIRRAGAKIKEEYQIGAGFEQLGMNSAHYKDDLMTAGENAVKNLDIGFRVLKLDSTNMKDVYYNPADFEPSLFDSVTDNIKEDRTPEDLLFQVMLELGVLLSSKIEESTIGGKRVFNVADGFLIACFDDNVTDETVKAIAQQKPYYAVFRDSSMATDSVATNFDQIFAAYSPETVRKVL